MTIPAPPIADTLRVILPSADDLLLLRVLAGPDETIAKAWSAWRTSKLNVRRLFGEQRPELRRLLPLLAYRLRRSGIDVDDELQPVLHAAQLWEELRAQRILEILDATLDALSAAQIVPCLVGGLATTVVGYPKLHLRHCHDIDLLIPAEVVGEAETALLEAGFQADTSVERRTTVSLHHRDGLPINLHTSLLESEFYRLPESDMLRRVRSHQLAGHTVGVFASTDALLHRLARIVTAKSPKPLSAMVDAALVTAAVADDPEWDRLAVDAIAARLHLQLFVILSCLHRTTDCQVPERVRRRLAQAASHADAESIDMALHHARTGRRISITTMIGASGWRSRLHILRWLIVPSPRFLRDWCARRGLAWTPLWYLGRPFRRMAIRASRVGRRAAAGPPRNNMNVPGA